MTYDETSPENSSGLVMIKEFYSGSLQTSIQAKALEYS